MRGRAGGCGIIADGLSRQVQAGLAGGVAALYPDLPQKARTAGIGRLSRGTGGQARMRVR